MSTLRLQENGSSFNSEPSLPGERLRDGTGDLQKATAIVQLGNGLVLILEILYIA